MFVIHDFNWDVVVKPFNAVISDEFGSLFIASATLVLSHIAEFYALYLKSKKRG